MYGLWMTGYYYCFYLIIVGLDTSDELFMDHHYPVDIVCDVWYASDGTFGNVGVYKYVAWCPGKTTEALGLNQTIM